jgi:hypothetical protein
MGRTSLVVGVVAAAVIVARLDAQSPPDLSGKWVFVSSEPAGTRVLGSDFSIAQDAATLRIDFTAFCYDGETTGAWTATPVPTRTVYVLDGIEHPSQVIVNQPTTNPAAWTFRSTMSSITEVQVDRAGFDTVGE